MKLEYVKFAYWMKEKEAQDFYFSTLTSWEDMQISVSRSSLTTQKNKPFSE